MSEFTHPNPISCLEQTVLHTRYVMWFKDANKVSVFGFIM
jgi:hypothetical protein